MNMMTQMSNESVQDELKVLVYQLMREKPMLRPVELANCLGLNEWQVISVFEQDLVTRLPGKLAKLVMAEIAHWGDVTTIVERAGSIFEFKGSLPEGKDAFGYYNLLGKPGQLHGHLKLDQVFNIALLSKPLRGKDAFAVVFYDRLGDCIFKIYLGRDAQGVVYSHQINAFNRLKELSDET